MQCGLFRAVVMILIGSCGLRAVQTKRVGRTSAVCRIEVGIARLQTASGKAVDGGCVREGMEHGFSRRICGVGIGREIVIKRNVFLENDNQVLDGGCRSRGG